MNRFNTSLGKKTVLSDGFEWNCCDVCINPEKIHKENGKDYIDIELASYKGKFGFGYGFWCNSYLGGSAHGVRIDDCVYKSRHEATRAAVNILRDYFKSRKDCYNMIKIVDSFLAEKRQLTLFDF